MCKKYIFIILLFFLNTTNQKLNKNINESELIFVYEHFRHGARGPPFDSNSNYTMNMEQNGLVMEN